MSVSMIGPKFYAWGRDGLPLAFGKLYTYKARTNAPKDTYQSEDGIVANTNPVILNGEGYANVYLDGSYKVVLKDSDDNEIWSADPVTAQGGEEWVNCVSASYLSASSFKVTGNVTDKYDSGRRVRIDNSTTEYSFSSIDTAVFAGGETTITLTDSIVLAGIVSVCASIVGGDTLDYNKAEVTATGTTTPRTLADWTEKEILSYYSVDDAKADSLLEVGRRVKTYGYQAAGDGGNGDYIVVAGGTGVDDGGSYLDMDNGNQLELNLGIKVSVLQYGGVGDGLTNNNSVFTALEAAAFTDVYVPDGSFVITGLSLQKNYTGPGEINLDGKIQINDKSFVYISPGSPRDIIQYKSTNSVNIRSKQYPMGGFRFMGQYKEPKGPVFTAASEVSIASTLTDLPFGMSSVKLENWYGVFACANQGDSAPTFRTVPFLRIKSDLGGGLFGLAPAGEGITAAEIADPSLLPTPTYTWPADGLNESELLVITETLDGRANAFSGRTTTITDSTTTTITIEDVGTIAALDWVLPAPNVEFEFYRYCGAFYVDTAEVRNIADSGTLVKSRGTQDLTGTNTGQVVAGEKREPSGNISPLATAVYLQSTGNLSTPSTGQYLEEFGMDDIHEVTKFDMTKVATTSQSFNSGEVTVPFLFGPQYYYNNAGAIASSRLNGSQNLWGWIEP